jgi:hypothetical protein
MFEILVSSAAPNLSAIQDSAQLKVDLRKAQEACERLTRQLLDLEEIKERIETDLTEKAEELGVARKAKDNSMQACGSRGCLACYAGFSHGSVTRMINVKRWHFSEHVIQHCNGGSIVWEIVQ